MKKIVFLIVFLSAVIVRGFGQEESTLTFFEGKNITGLDVSGVWEIHLTQGTDTKAVLTFPKRFEKQLKVTLDADGQLEIGFRGDIHAKNNERFIAEIVCSSLQKVDLSGACRLEGMGNFTTHQIKFDLTGSSKVQMNGEISVAGNLTIDMSGASKLTCKVTAQRFSIDASGASTLELAGKAVNAGVEASGAVKLNMEHAELQQVELDASGASKVILHATGLITGEISGASKVWYAGEANTRLDVSGAASLKHN